MLEGGTLMDTGTLWEMSKPIVVSQAGRLATLAGGALVADGAIGQGDLPEFVKIATGIVLWAIPAAYSWWNSVGKEKLVAQLAKMHPIVPPNATVGEALKAANSAAIITAPAPAVAK
jgi:hypothetical protein